MVSSRPCWTSWKQQQPQGLQAPAGLGTPLHSRCLPSLSLPLARAYRAQLCARQVCGVDGAEQDAAPDLQDPEPGEGDERDPQNTHFFQAGEAQERKGCPQVLWEWDKVSFGT